MAIEKTVPGLIGIVHMCWYVLMLNHCLVEPLLVTCSNSESHFISSFDFHCCSSMNYFKYRARLFLTFGHLVASSFHWSLIIREKPAKI